MDGDALGPRFRSVDLGWGRICSAMLASCVAADGRIYFLGFVCILCWSPQATTGYGSQLCPVCWLRVGVSRMAP